MRQLPLVLFLILAPHLTFAESALFFPVDHSDVRKLPQRFEYQLVNRDQFRLGDILIDARRIQFQLLKSGANPRVKLFWPAALLTSGDLSLQDDVGKAIWHSTISPQIVRIQKGRNELNGESLRIDQASLEVGNIDPEAWTRIHLLPFFRFCVHKEEKNTKIDLCSRALFFKHEGKSETIEARDSLRPDSFVEVNGRVVGNQGIIFLQNRQDLISMRALMLSGVSLDVDTQMKDLDLRDLHLEGDKLLMTAAGSEPVDTDKIQNQNKDTWTTQLDPQFPTIYVKGEGGIPMRQDLLLGKSMRPTDLKVPFASPTTGVVFSASTSIVLITPPNVTLSAYDKNTDVEKIGDNQWRWTLKNLALDQTSRRYVNVITADGSFVGATDLYRGRRWEIYGMGGIYPLTALARATGWWNSHWGTSLQFEDFVTQNAGEPALTDLSLALHYRFHPTERGLNQSSSAAISYESYSSGPVSASALAIMGEWITKAPESWVRYNDQFLARLKVPILSLTSSVTLNTSSKTELLFRKNYSQTFLEYGLSYETLHLQYGAAASDWDRLQIVAGFGKSF